MRIQSIGDPERLSHTPRTGGQIPLAAAPSDHDVQALDRIDGPKEHGTGVTDRSGDHVQAPVEAITEIDVSGSRCPEHRSVAARPADTSSRMGSRIIRTGVCLDFNDDSGRSAPVHCRHEPRPE
jgi:hypothetical protein